MTARTSTAIPLPDPRLEDSTTGVVLRPWQDSSEDAAALASAWRDPGVLAETKPPEDSSAAAAEGWITGDAERRERGLALDLVIADTSPPPSEGTEGLDHSGASDDPDDSRDEVPQERAVGEVGLVNFDETGRAEVGFWLAPEARGRGVATTAVRLLTRWALSEDGLGCRQVWARVRPGNAQAEAVLGHAGFRRLGEACGQAIWSCT